MKTYLGNAKGKVEEDEPIEVLQWPGVAEI